MNTLIMLTPLSDDNMIEPRIQIISGYVAWRFCQMAERTQWFQAPQLFMNFEGNASAPCFRGWMFECFVFCKFMEGLNFNIFPLPFITGKDPSSSSRAVYTNVTLSSGYQEFSNLTQLEVTLRKCKGSLDVDETIYNKFLIPTFKNLSTIDALAVVRSDDKAQPIVFLFQIAVSNHHPIKLTGLNDLYEFF